MTQTATYRVPTDDNSLDAEVVVVGAGFAGMYMLYRLRQLGMSTIVLDGADDVGGTWYWNRYPGARCDVQSVDYSYSFDADLEREWTWSERYATQPEILRYADFVATKHDLRRDIRFSTRVESAAWDDANSRWLINTDTHGQITCRHYVMATGCLSLPKSPDIEGHERFSGEIYFTGKWPHDKVDFTSKRVAVIGTGSSAIQSIPLIADEAADVTVFQRTPNFTMPAWNGPVLDEKLAAIRGREAEYREEARRSRAGVPLAASEVGVLQVSAADRLARFEGVWQQGELFAPFAAFNDLGISRDANDLFTDFLRGKIRSIVDDPATAETLSPRGHYWGTKRPCLDTDYYATYNRPNVRLIDLHKDPISSITETGIDTASESMEFDAIVYAIGFDAMTGALVDVDITGRDGVSLEDAWQDGPTTYLGLTSVGFPNLFMITGPGSPSVLSNMMVSIEQHVDWIANCLTDLRERGKTTIEPTQTAQDGWGRHVNDCANITLYPTADSWYMGSNVPGKPRVFLPYVGGVDSYRQACDDVVEQNYLGFALDGPDGPSTSDGVIRRVQPDVMMVLQVMAELGLPPLESMSPDGARAFMTMTQAMRPPGPDVGEVIDAVLPGADGDLEYRLYRPTSDGPHPVVAYFHGGGWVLGSLESDDPFCRDLCVQSDSIIMSVNYRHAPEHPFPAAHDDADAAVRWIADNAAALGGIPDRVAVCGWSAGANLAASTALAARDAGGPAIAAQILVNPTTDADFSRQSYDENGEDFILTEGLMRWFYDHYVDEADRADPRLSVLNAENLADLPSTVIVTAEFDPLRDEGVAYAEALAAAGTPVHHIPLRGHMHTSLTSVGVVISSGPPRAELASAMRDLLREPAHS